MMTWQLEMEKLTVTMKVPKKAKRAKKLHQIRSDLPNLKKDLLQVENILRPMVYLNYFRSFHFKLNIKPIKSC